MPEFLWAPGKWEVSSDAWKLTSVESWLTADSWRSSQKNCVHKSNFPETEASGLQSPTGSRQMKWAHSASGDEPSPKSDHQAVSNVACIDIKVKQLCSLNGIGWTPSRDSSYNPDMYKEVWGKGKEETVFNYLLKNTEFKHKMIVWKWQDWLLPLEKGEVLNQVLLQRNYKNHMFALHLGNKIVLSLSLSLSQ